MILLVGSASAQSVDAPGTLSEMPLPGGLRAALTAIDDHAAADRSQFLLEFIRRTYHTPLGAKNDPRELVLQSLLAELDASSRQSERPDKLRAGPSDPPTSSGSSRAQSRDDKLSAGPDGSAETLPLPLSAGFWMDVVFGGRATSQSLVSAILRSRSASLLYYGLLSLDDQTRSWLATQPDLVADLMSQHSEAFVAAASGLRVTGTAIRVPGGEAAQPVWEALVGRRANEPAGFVRALLARDEGRLAYFFGAISQLTPAQIRFVMNLESSDASRRVDATRRLYAVFERLAPGWKLEARLFWRPTLDPALLAADLRVDGDGRPMLSGTREFWAAVFADGDRGRNKSATKQGREDNPRTLADGEPVDFAWLCDQVFKGDQIEQRRRHHLVLFASRNIRSVTPETVHDAIEAVRAAGSYPALVATLERAKLVDIAAFASAARRATRLSAIDDDTRAARALAQFQGTLAVVARAVLLGSVPTEALSNIVRSLSAVDLSERGEYEGRLVRWLDAHLRELSRSATSVARTSGESPSDVYDDETGPMDQALLRMLAGPDVLESRFVDWEGTRYRLDMTTAEATRLARLLGDGARPYVSSARKLIAIADAMSEAGLTREELQRQVELLEQVARALGWEESDLSLVRLGSRSSSVDGPRHQGRAESRRGATSSGLPRTSSHGDDAPGNYREIAAALRRLAHDGDVRGARRLAPALCTLGDDVLARGLMELVYAVALGQPDRASISPTEAASRHDFGLRVEGLRRSAPWRLPLAAGDVVRGWHVTGSLLGLDVKLAQFLLVSLSSRPPLRRPTLNEDDRRVFVEAIALIESDSLTESDRDTIVEAIRKGRARLGAVRTPMDAVAIADEIHLSPTRRALLPWVVAHQPERIGVFLSPSELLWLGLEKMPMDARLHVWGAPGEPRLGCLCLQFFERRPWETLAGRWNSGIFATAFPDLNLRLAELLAELKMPASLLAPVLASATLEFINNVVSRDYDDRRGLVEFVQGLGPERVEQYLALLTTDGPLVPDAATETARNAEVRR